MTLAVFILGAMGCGEIMEVARLPEVRVYSALLMPMGMGIVLRSIPATAGVGSPRRLIVVLP